MKTSNVISRETQKHFWCVVRECLKEFHQAGPDVYRRLKKLQTAINGSPIPEIEIFFHNEPFDVACNIARNRIPMEPVLQRYLSIRDAPDCSH